jgi:hypothetical protein
MSEPKPLKPVVRNFLLCREIFQDASSQEYVLIGPAVNLVSSQFPFAGTASFFAQVTSLRGSYHLALQLHSEEGDVIWTNKLDHPLQMQDPLQTSSLAFLRMAVFVPKPGRYDFVLLANDQEAARYPVTAAFPAPKVAGGPPDG